MSDTRIHPTAIIESGAVLGKNVTIEPYAIIKANVILEDDVVVKSHAYLDGFTTIGEGTVIYPGACIGTKTQDKKFKGEKTFVKIGKHCEIREFVTINSSCQENSVVQIGDHCLIMAYCHVAHNCVVGNHVIMSNNATLAGHVIVEDYAIIGGFTPIHQFVRIGTHAMVGGMSRVAKDIPPYLIGAGVPFKFGGVNLIGLKRRGFTFKTRQSLGRAFKILYRSNLYLENALNKIEAEMGEIPEVQHFISFCRDSKRGLAALQGAADEDFEAQPQEEKYEESNAHNLSVAT